MLAAVTVGNYNWLCNGRDIFPAMLAAIDAAHQSVCLEVYTYSAGPLGEKFLNALVGACQRGASVRVMIDAIGSIGLSGNFWKPLRAAGGEVRQFNPRSVNWAGTRDHRKLLVCDKRIAFVGGFNIAPEYEGDGVTRGWCEIGLKVEGPLAGQLAGAFDEMFTRTTLPGKLLMALRRSRARRTAVAPPEQLLLSGPGPGRSPVKTALRRDLAHARDVRIIMAYFLPTWRIRRALLRVIRQGGRVQLILAGKSDVMVSQLAGQSLYRRLLKAGVEIYEYQPQILHAKLIIIDDVVHVGSANLDHRSLLINYELMIRFASKEMADQARGVFANTLQHTRRITLEGWKKGRTLWRRFKQHWAYFFLVRVDPYVALRRWRTLSD